MIAALHSSRPGATKKFEIDGCNFGWKTLEELFLREVERARTNQLRRVKDLKESHIYRDCWTRLNVKPAKIMQVGIHTVCDIPINAVVHDLAFLVPSYGW